MINHKCLLHFLSFSNFLTLKPSKIKDSFGISAELFSTCLLFDVERVTFLVLGVQVNKTC